MRLPIIVITPIIIPSILGQSVPDCGRVGAVGVGVGLDEPVGVGVTVGVEVGVSLGVGVGVSVGVGVGVGVVHVQFDSSLQDAFLQLPVVAPDAT